MKVQLLFLLLLLGVVFPSTSQTIVTGIVLDENSDPIVAATIRVKNFSLLATTDSLGRFEIFVPPNKFLAISKEGYYIKSQKITQNTPLPLSIRLRKKQATDNVVWVIGTVIDHTSGVPLKGATIFSQELATQTATDALGQFELEAPILSLIHI